jgi:hypothetical protein
MNFVEPPVNSNESLVTVGDVLLYFFAGRFAPAIEDPIMIGLMKFDFYTECRLISTVSK